jgi:hypothetical protein
MRLENKLIGVLKDSNWMVFGFKHPLLSEVYLKERLYYFVTLFYCVWNERSKQWF